MSKEMSGIPIPIASHFNGAYALSREICQYKRRD